MMDVCLLGTGGMMPLPGRYLTSLICRLNGRLLLVDCGEGTQVSMKILGWGFKNVDAICFTHYHADHAAGLPGLLLTIGNSGRTEPLTLIGPPDLARIVNGLTVITPELPFDLNIVELPYSGTRDMPVADTEYILGALPLEHSRTCFAYSIETHRRGKFDPDKAEKLGLPKKYWSVLQNGEDMPYEGNVYTPEMVLGPARKGIKLCYLTDSRPVRTIPGFIREADLFVCEGIYGEDEKLATAKEHKHMIFSEAARLALEGGVKKLWLTHYSPALVNPGEFVNVARGIFPESYAGYDRIACTIHFEDAEACGDS